MADPLHCIRAERLDVEIGGEPLAIALQSRIGDLNRQRLLPVIERVLYEFESPRRYTRIDRLAVDLGVLPLAGLEQAAETALYEALHRALREAIGDGTWLQRAATDEEPSDGEIAVLSYYLQFGTLPFWVASVGIPKSGFSALQLMRSLLAREPAALAGMIRRIGREPQVLERLVLQLDESMLQDLLRLLEPEHAGLIIAYMLDLRLVHRAEPTLNLDDATFGRLLWTLALSYLLRDPGSQFNRKSFVVALLEGISEEEGIDYRRLVETLARGLEKTLRHVPLVSSLPAVIAEIAQEIGVAQDTDAPVDAAVDIEEPAKSDPAALAEMVRRYAGDRRMLEQLVSQHDEATLQAVLRLLDPLHAALVIGYLIDLRQVPRTASFVVRGEAAFRQLLWVLTLSYFSREAGTQFNRKSFTQALLGGIARDEGIDYATLLVALAEGLDVTAARQPLGSSLLAVIEELSREITPEVLSAAEAAGGLAERYARLDALRHYFRHGVLPLNVLLRHPDWSAETLLAELPKLTPSQLPVPYFDFNVMSLVANPPIFPAQDRLGDPAEWSAPRLAAALLAGLRDDDPGAEDLEVLLDALLARYSVEASSFLHLIVASSERDALLARIPAMLFERLLAMLRSREASAIGFMITAIGGLPMSERPVLDAAMRGAILFEVLRSGPNVLERVLRAVFGGVPSAAVGDRLKSAFECAPLPEAVRAELIAAQAATQEEALATQAEAPYSIMRDGLFDWLAGAEPRRADALPLDVLLDALPEIAAAFPDELRTFVLRHAVRADLRERWINALPESALVRLIEAIEPRQAGFFVDSAELLHAAAVETASFRHVPPPARAAMWDVLIGYVAATPAAQRTRRGLVGGILARSPEDEEPLREAAARLAESAGRHGLVAALARGRDRKAPAQRSPTPRPMPRAKPPRARTAFSLRESERIDAEPVYIDNGGLVLAGAFLPHLFRSLEMLIEDESGRTRMRDQETAGRAVHLLQYLVEERCSAPEPLLALNKVLCGLPVEAPVVREIEPTARERELCDSLLSAMIDRWEIIRDSSVAALRETFLRREGRLLHKEESWELRVDRKTADVLVDRVPWNIGLIFNAWMPHPLHVTW